MMQEFFTLKQTLFDSQKERKASRLINKNTILWNHSDYIEYANSAVSMLKAYSCKTFAVIVEKPDIAISFPEGFLPKHYTHILKITELYCERENKSKALFVYDSQNTGADSSIASAFTNFLYRSSLGKRFNKILEIPLFASSEVTPCLQLVDIAASVIRQYYDLGLQGSSPSTDFEKWIDTMYKSIYSTTEDIYEPSSGFPHYGMYRMSKQTFQKDASEIPSETPRT